MDPR
ncbi:hypothetical protein YPPY100_1069, partial [Yersinia pestis PY-100]|jgi:hypothetical protein